MNAGQKPAGGSMRSSEARLPGRYTSEHPVAVAQRSSARYRRWPFQYQAPAPDTLTAASGLAVSLRAAGEYQAARELNEDTLARRRRVLGEDHPDTLTSAFILVGELTQLGEYQAAKELNEDILDRRRRVLGDRHLDTLGSAAFALILSGLAADPKARAAMETMKAAWSQPGEGRAPDG
jgi:Tetratricopeptide repeat